MTNNLQNKIQKLRDQIDDLRFRYHVENDPEVTDAMYQGLMDELKKLEEEHPELQSSDSPTQRIAGKPSEKFEKITHTVKQWSFNDAFSLEDVEQWQERNLKILEKKLGERPKDLTYSAELKIDGLHIVLIYTNGVLESAATRGDGVVGENVTANIKMIHSVPLKLKESIDVIAEGEVWMSENMLKKINREREQQDLPLYANPRNVAAGSIRQLDPAIVAERNLQFTAYDISDIDESLSSQSEELQKLKKLGFVTDANWKEITSLKDIENFWKYWEKHKHSRDFWVDGVVLKVNQLEYQELLGFTGKSPRWAIALKFAAEQGTTQVKDIYVQVGRTGVLTPVALMEPVPLAGTIVTHATLHNFDEIERLDIRVGDTVVVEKAGDIIPKVVRVLDKMRTGKEVKVQEITSCPICKSSVERKTITDKKKQSSSALFCTNKNCYAQELRRLTHFVSKKAFNIDGLGPKIIEQLVEEGLIKNAADLFTLTVGDLEPLERFAEKSAENTIASIHDAKRTTLPRFLFGLGIPNVGEETALALAEHFGSMEHIIHATEEELVNIIDVGPRVAESIRSFFDDTDNKMLVEDLQRNGVIIEQQEAKAHGMFDDMTFVLTGTLSSMTRDEAKDIIRSYGGSVSSSVSKKTSFVIAGSEPGSKLAKAEKYDVEVLSEQEFLNKIKNS